MRQISMRAKRCLALFLTLVLMASNVTVGLTPWAKAAEAVEEITDGALVAGYYELTDGEQTLLRSGLLPENTYKYAVPTDSNGLISVDTETKTVTASDFTDACDNVWTPVSAKIVVDGTARETLTVSENQCVYKYSGNAFSVEVSYALYFGVNATAQGTLLKTAGWLQQGVKNLDMLADSETRSELGVVGRAADTLAQLADGLVVAEWGGTTTVTCSFTSDDAKAAAKALKAETDVNGSEKLDLDALLDAYTVTSKTQYLLRSGSDMQAETETTRDNLQAILDDTQFWNEVDTYSRQSWVSDAAKAKLNQAKALQSEMQKWVATANTVLASDWTAASEGTVLVKTGMTDDEYQTLDGLVAALPAALTNVDALKLAEALPVEPATVQYNMSMWNVNVTVQLKVAGATADSTDLTVFGTKTGKVTLADGMSREDVLTAVTASGLETAALTEWAEVYDTEHFDRSATELGSTLTADTDYTVTYSPKTYTITYGAGFDGKTAESVPYGYRITLEQYAASEQVYDYTVNGVYYAQGGVYTVTGDTNVSRKIGKAYAPSNLYTVTAKSAGSPLTEKEQAILTSGALNGNVVINARYPDTDSALVTLSGNTLRAANYASDYAGNIWKPYSYTVVNGTNETIHYFNGGNEAVINESAYDQIKVFYRLALSNITDAEILAAMNLPKTLAEEAENQKDALDRLSSGNVYSNMGQLDRTKLGALNGVIDVTNLTEDEATNARLKAYFKGVVSNMIDGCVDADGKLKLYNLITNYNDANNGGLAYYYQNSAAIMNEVNTLSGYLDEMLADAEKTEALTVLVTAAGYPQYADKIAGLRTEMDEIRVKLTAPDAAIDVTSANLRTLADALVMSGTVNTYTAAQELNLSAGPFVVAADTKAIVKVTVQTADSSQSQTVSKTYTRNTALLQADITALKDEVSTAIAALGIQTKYYTDDYNAGVELDALIGQELAENVTKTYTWTPKQYTVHIDGEADQYITVNSRSITLPAAESGYRYEYTIGGSKVLAGTYTFTESDLDTLFASGSYTIARVKINERSEKLDRAVAALNAAATGQSIVFTLNPERTTLTASVAAGTAGSRKSDLANVAMKLLDVGYGYIGLNGKGFMYTNAENSLELSLQAAADAVLADSTVSSDKILANIGADGTLYNDGEIFITTIQMGNSAADIEQNLRFRVCLTSVPSSALELRNKLDEWKNNISLRFVDGEVSATLNLPEKVYEIYLWSLIMTGDADLRDANAVNQQVAYRALYDYIDVILGSDVTATTLSNTAAKLGKNVDLSEYESYINWAVETLGEENAFTCSGNGYTLNLTVTENQLNNALGRFISDAAKLEQIKAVVKECKSGGRLTAAMNAEVKNFGMSAGFEAVVLDKAALSASGFRAKAQAIDFTTDLSDRLTSAADMCAVMLQKDITDDLVITQNTYLDLNGHTIRGNVTVADGCKLVILDSTLVTDQCGGISGNLSGSSIVILAGSYSNDVSAWLKNGYVQNSGLVTNELYTITGSKDSLTFNLNADLLNGTVRPNKATVKALALDICSDLLLNYYTAGALKMDSNTIYQAIPTKLLELYASADTAGTAIDKVLASLDCAGLTKFVNSLIAGLTDFGTIANSISSDTAFANYTLSISPWALSIEHDDAADTLDIQLGADTAKAHDVKIALKIAGSDTNKNKAKDVAEGLAEIVKTKDITVNIDQPTRSGKTIQAAVQGSAGVEIDLTGDSDYAVVMATVLAYAGVYPSDFARAVNSGSTAAIKQVFDAVTVSQIVMALKKLSQETNFAAMANAVGVSVDVADAAKLEGIYHELLTAAGWLLERANVTGGSQTMASLERNAGEYGQYLADKQNVVKSGSATLYGDYVLGYNLTATNVSVLVKAFTEPVTYTVSFDANGGTGAMTSVTGVSGDYTLPACTFTAPDGKQFKGWALTADGAVITTSTITVSTNVTLYAIWEDIPAVKTLVSIAVTTAPSKTMYTEGESFDAAGMVVTATYSDNSTAVIRGYTYAPTGALSTADTAITISYTEGGVTKTVMQAITVRQASRPTGDGNVSACMVSYDANGGTGTMASSQVIAGTRIELPECGFTAPEGKSFKAWEINGREYLAGGFYVVNTSITVKALWEDIAAPSEKFTDLDQNAWYSDDVDYVIGNGWMNGISANEFDPYSPTTRAMVITTIYRLEKSPETAERNIYTDVKNNYWYTDAIIWGTEMGIINGYGNGEFGPDDYVDREQIVAMFARYAQYKNKMSDKRADLSEFMDADKVGKWATDYAEWAVAVDLIRGVSTTQKMLAPKDDSTRIQMAVLLARMSREVLK